MSEQNLPSQFLEKLDQVTGKRSRIVVEHILERGFITTEDLEQIYGYKHPPRAVKDVRDQGIPIETYSVKSSDGRTIAAYRFGDPSEIRGGRLGGRTTFSRRFKNALYRQGGGKCAICNGDFLIRELQIDHRVPYEVAGDIDYSEADTSAYMLLCGSCNRAKSWSCEQCPNWQERSLQVCQSCYWAKPTDYLHVATNNVRRTDVIWEGDDEMSVYDKITASASQAQQSVQEYIKNLLKNVFLSIMKLFTFLS